jgi:hypothetical protein
MQYFLTNLFRTKNLYILYKIYSCFIFCLIAFYIYTLINSNINFNTQQFYFYNFLILTKSTIFFSPIIEEFTYRFWMFKSTKKLFYFYSYSMLVFLFETIELINNFLKFEFINKILYFYNFNYYEFDYVNNFNIYKVHWSSNYRYLIVPLMIMPLIFIYNKFLFAGYLKIYNKIQSLKLFLPIIIISVLSFAFSHQDLILLSGNDYFIRLFSLILIGFILSIYRVNFSYVSSVMIHIFLNTSALLFIGLPKTNQNFSPYIYLLFLILLNIIIHCHLSQNKNKY